MGTILGGLWSPVCHFSTYMKQRPWMAIPRASERLKCGILIAWTRGHLPSPKLLAAIQSGRTIPVPCADHKEAMTGAAYMSL